MALTHRVSTICTEGLNMKKHWSLIGTAALVIGSLLPVNGTPAIAQVFNAGSTVAQNILRQPKVNLHLAAEQQVVSQTAQGKSVRTWAALTDSVKVKPGDVLRFTVTGKNEGSKAANSFTITQPVPRGTVIVLDTTTASTSATVTYSIDQGKTFVAHPMVKVTLPDGKVAEKPAPAEVYTHVRWNLAQALQPEAEMNAAYNVMVR
jgi:uncharacterized repeat protein (TIGR01451 family)